MTFQYFFLMLNSLNSHRGVTVGERVRGRLHRRLYCPGFGRWSGVVKNGGWHQRSRGSEEDWRTRGDCRRGQGPDRSGHCVGGPGVWTDVCWYAEPVEVLEDRSDVVERVGVDEQRSGCTYVWMTCSFICHLQLVIIINSNKKTKQITPKQMPSLKLFRMRLEESSRKVSTVNPSSFGFDVIELNHTDSCRSSHRPYWFVR